MQDAMRRFTETFGPEALTDLVFRWVPSIVTALLTALILYLVYRAVTEALRQAFDRVDYDPTAEALVKTVAQSTIAAVAVLAVIGQLGVDTTSIIASLGIAGLTLGFAAQNTLSNIISGLFIFWDRPFVIGDLVEINGVYGQVEAITLRSTRIITVDGKMVAIPNQVVAEGAVVSYTNFPGLRLDIPVTINVIETVDRVRTLLLAVVDGDSRYQTDPPPQVVVSALNDYNTELELRVWLRDERQHVAERFRLRERVYINLTEAGVDMPFETLRLEPLRVLSEPRAGEESAL